MAKLVTIFGGSGFVGRYIARRLAYQGWRIRVAVRHVKEAGFVRTYGAVGQVEPVFCNIRDDQSVAEVLTGADAVVNCVGILAETGRNSFAAVQAEGAARIARLSAAAGVGRLVHISAIGADATSASAYARTKADGEAAVLEHMPDAIILRPSIIFGAEDGFFNRFAGMTFTSPVLPVVGAKTRFQPVYVDDVAQAAALAVSGQAAPGIYELGGPDVESFADLMKRMLTVIRRRRLVLGLPFWMGRIMGAVFGAVQWISGGLIKAPLTRDQVANLRSDNVVSDGANGFAELGISSVSMDAILPEYLWRFRPDGQYNEITKSAANLRG